MATCPVSSPAYPSMAPFGAETANAQLHWHAVYTCSRHEKTIARHFEERGITCFLPLYQAIHRWNKRCSRVSLPLFPGYVFVRVNSSDRSLPLRVPGVLHYVGLGTAPCIIEDEEIEGLQKILINAKEVGPHPYLSAGQRVQIAAGPLAGLSGVIQRTKAGNRFVVSVETLKQSIAIEIEGYRIVASASSSEARGHSQAVLAA